MSVQRPMQLATHSREAAHPRKLKKLGHQQGKLQGSHTSRHSHEDAEVSAAQQFSLEATGTVVGLHRTIWTVGNRRVPNVSGSWSA